MKILPQNSWCSIWDSNLMPSKYESLGLPVPQAVLVCLCLGASVLSVRFITERGKRFAVVGVFRVEDEASIHTYIHTYIHTSYIFRILCFLISSETCSLGLRYSGRWRFQIRFSVSWRRDIERVGVEIKPWSRVGEMSRFQRRPEWLLVFMCFLSPSRQMQVQFLDRHDHFLTYSFQTNRLLVMTGQFHMSSMLGL
jgi:hypothetical protein